MFESFLTYFFGSMIIFCILCGVFVNFIKCLLGNLYLLTNLCCKLNLVGTPEGDQVVVILRLERFLARRQIVERSQFFDAKK